MAIWPELLLVGLIAPAQVDTRFEQLAPPPAAVRAEFAPVRRPDMRRAVVLLHGLRPHPVSAEAAARAEPSYWEKPQGPIVQALAPDADVYAFHYAQTIPLDDVARLPALAQSVRTLRAAGYEQVILVGYSVGGVIARQFVEDTVRSGVTKVVQVCPPNAGSDWTLLSPGVRAVQAPFIRSLTKEERRAAARTRADKTIPESIEFVCIVAAMNWIGDGVVRRDSQWPADLQAQGIPAEIVYVPHVGAMYSTRVAQRIAEVVATPQPRWSPERVIAARAKVLGLASILSEPPSDGTNDTLIRIERREFAPAKPRE